MNEIKFRAWDKKDRVVVGMSFYHDSVMEDIEYGRYLQDDARRFELMQYTGLKDKNGVEIYEGDVLPEGYVVTFIDGSEPENLGMDIGFYGQRDNFESWFTLEVGFPHEVIGNIYENPELLEYNQ